MHARKGPRGEVALEALMERRDIGLVALSADGSRLARLAYARFGKGVGSPSALNYSDSLAYGVAMAAREPLLFKRDDFGQSHVGAAAY